MRGLRGPVLSAVPAAAGDGEGDKGDKGDKGDEQHDGQDAARHGVSVSEILQTGALQPVRMFIAPCTT
jgi:hypothetical protein